MNHRQLVNNGMLFYEEGQLRQSRGQLLIALTAELMLTVEYVGKMIGQLVLGLEVVFSYGRLK